MAAKRSLSYKLSFTDNRGPKWVRGANAKDAVEGHYRFHPDSPPVYTVQRADGKMIRDSLWNEAKRPPKMFKTTPSLFNSLLDWHKENERFLTLSRKWDKGEIVRVLIGWMGQNRARQMNDFIEKKEKEGS